MGGTVLKDCLWFPIVENCIQPVTSTVITQNIHVAKIGIRHPEDLSVSGSKTVPNNPALISSILRCGCGIEWGFCRLTSTTSSQGIDSVKNLPMQSCVSNMCN